MKWASFFYYQEDSVFLYHVAHVRIVSVCYERSCHGAGMTSQLPPSLRAHQWPYG